MICPACSQELCHLDAGGGVFLDVCDEGCGGIWFDAHELKRLDEAHEMPDSPALAVRPAAGASAPAASGPEEHGGAVGAVSRRPQVACEGAPKRTCPRCECVKMRRFFYSAKRQVEIDQCGGCGGTWLDNGELQKIRAETACQGHDEFAKAAMDDRIHHAVRFMEHRGHHRH
jgi:Zn-finger nucleic acid-binding protein